MSVYWKSKWLCYLRVDLYHSREKMRGKRESWNKFSESLPQMKLGNGHIGVIILFHVLLYVIDIFKK